MQAWDKFLKIKHAQSEEVQELLSKLLQDLQSINEELAEYINTPSWNLPTSSYDDDDDDVEDLVHTPSESDGISEGECDFPVCDDSSPKKDEVLDDIISIPPRNGNDHFNAESSPSESMLNRDNMISSPKIDPLIEEFAGELALLAPIPPRIIEANLDPKEDICFIENLMYDNSFPRPPEILKDDSKTVIDSNNDYSSSDGDSYKDIDYVDASPLDSELASLEVVEIVNPEVGGIDIDILLIIKDDILREKLLNVNLLIAKIEALKDNLTPSSDFVTKSSSTSPNFFLEETNTFDNSLPESETFCFNLESDFLSRRSSPVKLGSLISPSEYDHFSLLRSKPDAGQISLWMAVEVFLIIRQEKTRVMCSNVLPSHTPCIWISNFIFLVIPSDRPCNFFSSELENNIRSLDFHSSQSKIFLSWDAFSISFIRDPLFPVIDTLLPFSSENEDKVVNTGILPAGEEKSPHLSSHRGLKALNESPMMILGENNPNLGLSRIFEASRARGIVLRSLELQILSFIWEIQYPNLID
ncbi:hypothetical protein Tco_0315963 [Tanacetum coccineum]